MTEPSALTVIITNMLTIVPPTIMAFAALKTAQRTEKKVGDPTDQEGNRTSIAARTTSQDSTLRLATAILDRIDERLEAVEKTQLQSMRWHENHEEWHAAGMPERRKRPRD